MLSKFLPLGALALMLGAFAAPASAAPVSSLDGVKGGSPSATEQIAYRRCWWEHGRRHCRRTVTRYYYDDGYYGYGPGYYGPGIGLYFGGGGHHRHGGHHHR
jgi:hypothetical protein